MRCVCWQDRLGDVMRHKKRVCALLRVGIFLGLLLTLPLVLKSGSSAFAEESFASPAVEESEQTKDGINSEQIQSSDDLVQDTNANESDTGEESDPSTTASDPSKYATLDEGTYFLTSTLSGHRVLDVPGGSVSAGAAIQLYGRNETAAQQFVLVDLGNRQYAFKNIKSGLYLCYPNDASRFSDHPRLTQDTGDDGAWGFAWHARQVGGGYVFSPVVDDDFSIDIAGASDSNGTEIRLFNPTNPLLRRLRSRSLRLPSSPSLQPPTPPTSLTAPTIFARQKVPGRRLMLRADLGHRERMSKYMLSTPQVHKRGAFLMTKMALLH